MDSSYEENSYDLGASSSCGSPMGTEVCQTPAGRPMLVWTERSTAYQRMIIRGSIINTINIQDPLVFLEECQTAFESVVQQLEKNNQYKITACLECDFMIVKPCAEESFQLSKIYLSSPVDVLHSFDRDVFFRYKIIEPILARFDNFSDRESGKALKQIIGLHIDFHCIDHVGSCYKVLPSPFNHPMKGIVNVKNSDHYCFIWSIAAMLCHRTRSFIKNCNRTIHYKDTFHTLMNTLQFINIIFPMPVSQMSQFEDQNPEYSCDVYHLLWSKTHKKWYVNQIYYSSGVKKFHSNLLLYKKHYCWIKDLSRALGSPLSKDDQNTFH